MSAETALALATNPSAAGAAVTPTQVPIEELQSNRIAILAKKESQLQKEREAFKREREEWTTKDKAEADRYLTKGREFDEVRAKDPVAALKLIGFSDTEIFNFISASEKTEPTAEEIATRAAESATQKLRDEFAQKEADAEKAQNTRLIQKLRSDIGSEIKENSEKYEYCAFEGAAAEEQAYEFIVEDVKANKDMPGFKMLSPSEALDMVEELYEERDKAMAGLKKRQPKVEATAGADPKSALAEKAPTSNMTAKKSPTLTNQVAATASSMAAVVNRRETNEEKKTRLIEALKRGAL